jgi:CRP/FNR family transcriptional regulator
MITKHVSTPSCRDCVTRKNSCFSILSSQDVDLLDATKEATFYTKGQAVFHSGRTPTGVFCLLEGKVKMAKTGSDGKDQIVRFVLPGKLLGIRAFLSDSVYTATATVLEDSWICYLPKDTFTHLQSKYPSITSCMVTTLSQLLCEAEDKMTSIAQKNVRERLAETLLELLSVFSYGEKEKEEVHPISLSREDLANIVGTATETVIRLISEFRESDLIKVKGRRIYIKNVQALKKISKGYNYF